MRPDNPAERVLRFEVVIPGLAYRTLVSRLRSPAATPRISTARREKEIRAIIDLCPTSKIVAVTALGHHRLPKPVGIRHGSTTYQHLAHAISREIKRDKDSAETHAALLQHFQEIIARCPTVAEDTIRAEARDFELCETHSPASQNGWVAPTLAIRAPTLLLDLDDTPTLIIKTPNATDSSGAGAALEEALKAYIPPKAAVSGNIVQIAFSLVLPPLPEASIEFFLHWGSYEDLAPTWSDDPLATIIGKPHNHEVHLAFEAHVSLHGWYGAIPYARVNGSTERVWFGKPSSGDTRFKIERDDPLTTIDHAANVAAQRIAAMKHMQEFTSNPCTYEDLTSWFGTHYPLVSPGETLATMLSLCGNEKTELASLTAQHFATSHRDTITTLQTSYGLGELVFATPEASHAGAGGLAHVMSGLPLELSKAGIPITIISPLYHYQNGHKHASADDILRSGVKIGAEFIIPTYQTTISIHIGPTYCSGTSWVKRPPTTITFKVYLAETSRIRVFLLASRGVFDRLYQPVFSDEQLRRAIAFSRAVLETISTSSLGIRPSAIISNDWMTACVPAFAALDPAYQNVPWLRSCKTIHMIHNGGADYHGRLPIGVNGEDLWPMFNLAPEHYFGFKDPFRTDLLNVTMAAARHVRGGVITVSQPYARQLVSENGGGDGLELVLQDKRHSVFGVSNGISREDIDTYLALHTNLANEQLDNVPLLLQAKVRTMTTIQNRYGLDVSPRASLASFVGRIAEQKGLSLLFGSVSGSGVSALEELLLKHPQLQILIAGPITDGDLSASALRACVEDLSRRYPGRVAGVFDFIAHATALEISTASTLFLMPSRFEPGGITQLEALAVGTLVVGRAVGGIAATISNFDPSSGLGTGFLCHDYEPTAFANTAHWALSVCEDTSTYHSLVAQARKARHSWADRAATFAAVVQRIVLGEERMESLDFLSQQKVLSDLAAA